MVRNDDILDENTKRTKGSDALVSNIEAAKAVASIIKTTLGPMGMDKMLIDSAGDTVITNDGVKILREMEIEHPGAKILVEVAKTQESEIGDGTTSAVILCGELLTSAQKLLDMKIHPTLIISGYKRASEFALKVLEDCSVKVDPRKDKLIYDICNTAITGKVAEYSKERVINIIKEIVKNSKNDELDKKNIKIVKMVGGDTDESSLVRGVVIDKNPANINMPNMIKNGKILLVDFPLEIKELDSDAKVNINSVEEYENFLRNEEEYLISMVDKIKSLGINVIFCQKGIDDSIAYFLAKSGILAIRRVKKSDMEKLSLALRINIVSSEKDMNNFGISDVNVKKINAENYVFVENCKNPKSLSIALRSSTKHFVDEIERAIEDVLGDMNSILKSKKIVAGGGAVEVEIYTKLLEYSNKLKGKEQIIAKSFAESFLSIPKVLCENSGLSEIEVVSELISKHNSKFTKCGLDSYRGVVNDTIKVGIVEPINIKRQIIKSAVENSSMLLRIDDIIAAKKLDNDEKEEI